MTALPLSNDPSAYVVVDTRALYREQLGQGGIARENLTGLQNRLAEIHTALHDRCSGGLDAEFACLNLGHAMRPWLPQVLQRAEALSSYRDILLIGIGGSSLGTKALHQALVPKYANPSAPRLHFVENVDPHSLQQLLAQLNPQETAVVCISKSGGTLETVSQFLILRTWLVEALGANQARQQQWVITDPENGWLRQLAEKEGLATLPVPPQVGGRYSVLTAVGLLPLAAVGVEVSDLLKGAAQNASRCQSPDPGENPALEMAALFYLLDTTQDKRMAIMMPYVDRLQYFSDWYCQLWAESLGKWDTAHRDKPPAGTQPIRALGTVDQHSQLQMYLESRRDKIFTFIHLDHWEEPLPIPISEREANVFPYLKDKSLADVLDAEFRATRQIITDTGHPNMTLQLPALNAQVLGQLIDLYQRVAIYTGLLYGINPLDQPAVEEGKKIAHAYLQNAVGPVHRPRR